MDFHNDFVFFPELKRRKINDLSVLSTSGSGKISTSPVPQCNSVTVYSGNVMQTSQIVTNNNSNGTNSRLQMLGAQQPGSVSNMAYHSQQQQPIKQEPENEKLIGSVTLSKTPPWRKNSILQQQQSQTGQSTTLQQQNQMYATGNERIPPLPQTHLQQQSQNMTPPWQHQQQSDLIQTRVVKSRQSPNVTGTSANKKKPNFKDDPTGYLDHQTAILHNSILNVVSSPDLNETPPPSSVEEEDNFNVSVKVENREESEMPVRNEQQPATSVIQQNQNLYPRNHLQPSIESKQQPALVIKQQVQPHLQPVNHPNFLYQQNQPRMMAPSQIAEKVHHQHLQQQQPGLTGSNQSIQQQPLSQAQILATNVPSSQHQPQYLIEKHQPNQNPNHHGQLIRNAHFLTEADQQQATTTTIGGQTVTHFPNGMVQVEQNCDNNSMMIPLKPQQHVQLQQQIHQHNMLYRQSQQYQKVAGPSLRSVSSSSVSVANLPATYHNSSSGNEVKIGVSHESPVSSSTTFSQTGSEPVRSMLDSKGPAQVGAISTSNESPITCPSPADSDSTSSTIKSVPSPAAQVISRSQQPGSTFGTSQTTSRNTITSVQAGRTITVTTTSTTSEKSTLQPTLGLDSQTIQNREFQYHSQKLSPNHLIPVSSTLSGLQLQPAMREAGNQLIMTSTGQLIVMPAPPQPSKSATNQVLISSPSGNNLMHQQSVAVINQQGGVVNSVDVANSTTNHIIQNSPNGLVIQNATTGLVQPSTNMIQQGTGNLISQNGQNFIVNPATNGIQPMLLNNSNLIQQSGQNLNLIQTGPNGAKVISNSGNILNQSGNLISPNNSGLIGQQTVVLNTLPNGYVIQPNFATVDGQVVGQIVNQDNGNASFLQQQQTRQIILTSPDSKRKAKKRKSSASSSPSTPSSLSPQQSPNIQQQQQPSSMVQITSQYPSQGFQISPGIQGIAVVNKNTQPTAPQQQIIFQNGQLIQPMNIIGQQLLVPAGLVVAPDTTLLQIQNIGPCGNILTPQGMVLRAPSPQNKNFLSPSGPAGQQFIVSGNNQMSPLSQLYGAPVSLVVPQSNATGATATFVQQNATIVQQHATSASVGGAGNATSGVNTSSASAGTTNQDQGQNQGTASPPDTTTHSPRSPERPPSERSGGSDMVQCVSSSEPDSVVSPVAADSAQSPSTTDYDRSSSISYQSSTTNMYKPSDAKIRRVETPPQFSSTTTIIQESSNQMPPDSHESPSNSPTASSTSSTSSSLSSAPVGGQLTSGGISLGNNSIGGANGFNVGLPSFSIGQLVWGAARGHPAWPGKIVNPPDGACTPSDSTWVQWFGGRSNPELVGILSLKTLSEGLEAHHKAQKDTRKSRKLNQQLERAIQEAMTELDRISAMAQPTSTTHGVATTPGKSKSRGRQPATNSTIGHQRTKPIKIAPAPPCTSSIQQHQQLQQHRQQTSNQPHQHQPQSQTHQQHHPHSATQTNK
ncbi:unnamed protein product [Hermetia illucens]|uniref:PWWP domain-containing protein n=1 Tax=Hermetia illucens TaxID=343691 RepID=A0A7R8URQ9_HERIL|nr:unnamed protein product [Hermetia illucens]